MLNKIKKQILPMLETLGEALGQYLSAPSDSMQGEVSEFVYAIAVQLVEESKEAFTLAERLISSLQDTSTDEVERIYMEFCEKVEALPTQYKVVFLPYYDNTWDSLASVYEAFAADPMFVTEIVIIPISRNTPTGNKYVYNDYLTPQGIPNTHYDEYDYKTDLPDVVFYNQPYDGVNFPKFKSHNIKPYAGLMVYVPYFVTCNGYLTAERKEELVIPMTELPGHNNADIMVIQGDWFIKLFSNLSKNISKMIALGNPKTDNMHKLSESGQWTRHSEWEKKIGSRRTFLLNTHYTFIDSEYRNDIYHLLDCLFDFLAVNSNTALIWRPHPQTFYMAENRTDENANKLIRYIEAAQSSDRIIFDQTNSVVSAFMYSDAVISQLSSIVAEAVCMNKPIFLIGGDMQKKWDWNDMQQQYESSYQSILDDAKESNNNNCYLHGAVFHLGAEEVIPIGEDYFEYAWKAPFMRFLDEIADGIDSKKEVRERVRNHFFANNDGTCGSHILKHVKALLGGDS